MAAPTARRADVHALCSTAGVPDAQINLVVPHAEALPTAEPLPRGSVVGHLKGSSIAFLNRVGITGLVARSEWRRRRLLVLCYHGVSLEDEHRWDPHLYVSSETLRRRFEILRRHGCRVLPLGEAVERLAAGTLPPLAIVLTFDDGFFDFQARALPLLRRFDFPATVYLPTQRCEHNFPIVRLFLSYVLWKRRAATLDGRGLPGLDGRYTLNTARDRRRVVDALDGGMRAARLGLRAKDEVVRQVVERVGVDYMRLFDARLLRLLTPDEVAALASPSVEFQLHTHTHQTPADADLFVQEIRHNRERIEAMTGRPASHFCYPSGVYRSEYPALLRREGIVSATTCDPGLASRGSDPLLLPRFIDTELVSDSTFDAWVTGMAGWLPRRSGARSAAVAQ